MKVMPSVESEPDWTTSPLLTLSPWFRMIETPLRIAVAVPVSLVTWPMTSAATLALPSAWANWVCPVSALTISPVRCAPSGEASARPLLALEVIMQDDFAVVAGEDQVDARALEIAGEEQVRVRNDNGVRRRMCRNFVDDVELAIGRLAELRNLAEVHIDAGERLKPARSKFTSVIQMGTV